MRTQAKLKLVPEKAELAAGYSICKSCSTSSKETCPGAWRRTHEIPKRPILNLVADSFVHKTGIDQESKAFTKLFLNATLTTHFRLANGR